VGNEGPSAAIGAMIAQRFHRLLRLPRHLLRVALSVGASSGIAAIFVSPVTGIMFAVENLAHPFIRNYAWTLIAGSLLAFAVASSVLEPLLFGYSTGKALDYHYLIATGLFIPTITLFVYLYLGLKDRILLLLEGWFERRFRRGRILILSIVSGALIATILRIDPLAAFSGHEVVKIFINGSFHWPVWVIFTVILLRILATTLSLYANAVGGLFIALMSIGALIGYGFGEVSNLLFPWQVESFYFAAIGSAVFMGVLMRLPLTALVLALETTYDYNVIVPTGLSVVLVTYLVTRHFQLRKLHFRP
jgi:CIC family chloride channel protein